MEMVRKKRIDQIYNKSLLQKNPLLKKNVDRDPVGRIQAGSFRELWVWKSTKIIKSTPLYSRPIRIPIWKKNETIQYNSHLTPKLVNPSIQTFM